MTFLFSRRANLDISPSTGEGAEPIVPNSLTISCPSQKEVRW
jgi:hypothetical protein